MVRFIVGDLDLGSDWNSYVRQLDSAGLPRFVEMKQSAYDRVWR
ncbi:MAG: hypothetical protein ACLFP4_13710 [Spirochaetales bacterium]